MEFLELLIKRCAFKLSVVPGTHIRDEYTMFHLDSVFFFHFPKTFQPMRTRQLIKYKFSKYKIRLFTLSF